MRGRGGTVENVFYENVRHQDIRLMVVELTSFYASSTLKPKTETPPTIRNIFVKNISARGAKQAIDIVGLPEIPIRDVSFENVEIVADEGEAGWLRSQREEHALGRSRGLSGAGIERQERRHVDRRRLLARADTSCEHCRPDGGKSKDAPAIAGGPEKRRHSTLFSCSTRTTNCPRPPTRGRRPKSQRCTLKRPEDYWAACTSTTSGT